MYSTTALLLQSTVLFSYPKWFLGLCVLAGLLYAIALYYRDRSFGEQSSRLNKGLGLLRFTTVTIICMLLLSPVIKRTITQTEQPIVVLAQDNSASIGSEFSEEEQAQYQKDMEQLKAQLEEKWQSTQCPFVWCSLGRYGAQKRFDSQKSIQQSNYLLGRSV